jgi:hypothetical protein
MLTGVQTDFPAAPSKPETSQATLDVGRWRWMTRVRAIAKRKMFQGVSHRPIVHPAKRLLKPVADIVQCGLVRVSRW